MRHTTQHIHRPIKELSAQAIVSTDEAETADALAFVKKVFGVSPETLVAEGLILFPGVLRLSIQTEKNTAPQKQDYLLAWENNGQRNSIVALGEGPILARDDRIHITPIGFTDQYDGVSRDIRLEVQFSDIDFIQSFNLDLNQTTTRYEFERPIFKFDETCSDQAPFGDSGHLRIQLLGESLVKDIRTTFHEAASVAMDALASPSPYSAMPLAA